LNNKSIVWKCLRKIKNFFNEFFSDKDVSIYYKCPFSIFINSNFVALLDGFAERSFADNYNL